MQRKSTASSCRGCPCSQLLHPSAFLCLPPHRSFSKLTYRVSNGEGAEPAWPKNLSCSPSCPLLPFSSPYLLPAALPREGKDLGGCRGCLSSGLPLTPYPLLPCRYHALRQPAHGGWRMERCVRSPVGLGLDQRCPSFGKACQET